MENNLEGNNPTTIFFIIPGQRTDHGSRIRTAIFRKADVNLKG